MEKSSLNFVNKVPTYECSSCGKKNQYGDNCPYCGQKAKYVGLELPE